MLGLYRDNGKESGNYYMGVRGLPKSQVSAADASPGCERVAPWKEVGYACGAQEVPG